MTDMVEVKVDELRGEALMFAASEVHKRLYVIALESDGDYDGVRELIREQFGPTVRVPAELVKEGE